jgi:hypothetical protein
VSEPERPPLSDEEKAQHLRVLREHRAAGRYCTVCWPREKAPCALARASRNALTAAGVPLGQWIDEIDEEDPPPGDG